MSVIPLEAAVTLKSLLGAPLTVVTTGPVVAPLGTLVMLHVNVLVPVCEPSDTVAVTVYVPALPKGGVPAMRPVAASMLNPAGRPAAP